MRKIFLVIGLISILFLSSIVFISIGQDVNISNVNEILKLNRGNTLYIGLIGSNNYRTIQDIIDNVDVVVNKSINFTGVRKTCYGYQAYPNPDCIVSFDIDDPNNLNIISISNTSDKIAGGTWVNGVWWCCEYSSIGNSKIWTIDHLTGDMTLIGESGSGLNGLAFDDITDIMYACSSTHLFSIDMENAAATMIGSFNISGCVMVGIACDGYGNMYGEDIHTDSLYSIDLDTGNAVLIGAFGLDLNYGQDIAFDKETGICYLSAFTVHDGDEGALYICNLTNGATTKIGNLGLVPTQITGFAIPYNLNNPPTTPTINGPTSGKPGNTYSYAFLSIDPNGDDVFYEIDWGDGQVNPWDGPHKSNTVITRSHSWEEQGTFNICARAKDVNNAIGEWGTLEVIIPRNRALFKIHPILLWLFERFPILKYLLGI